MARTTLSTCKSIDEPALYHYTDGKNVPSISRKGLVPSMAQFIEQDVDKDESQPWTIHPVVWAASHQQMFGTLQAGFFETDAIIGIKKPGDQHFVYQGDGEYYSLDVIPPSVLCVVDPREYQKRK